MGLDSLLKRFFPLVLGTLLFLVAYLQASGVAELVGAKIVGNETAPLPVANAHPLAKQDLSDKSAGAILARNPFDSITGPLDGSRAVDEPVAPEPVRNGNDPYDDPPCPGVKASLISASEDAEWSFAALTGSDGRPQLRRKGDVVGGAQVTHIGWFPNAPEPDPRVWLSEAGARCMVGSGAIEPPPKKAAASTAEPSTKTSKSKRQQMSSDLESKIHKISDTKYEVERSAVNQIIQNYAQLGAGLRTKTSGGGMRLTGIRQNSVLSAIGMKNGDNLKSINGYDMGDQDKALEAYSKLRTAGKLTIDVERDGAPTTIDISIK